MIYYLQINDKRVHFDFDIVNCPFLDGDVPNATFCGVYISQLIRFVRAFSQVCEYITWIKIITVELLREGTSSIIYEKNS